MTAVVPRGAAVPEHAPDPASQRHPPARVRPRQSRTGRDRSWVWPLAAIALGGVAAWWPLAALALIAGGVVLVLAFTAPRATAGLTVLAVLFVRPLEHLLPVVKLGYPDEVLVALCVVTMPLRRLLARRPLRTFPGQWWFTGFVVCGVLSALVLHVPVAIFVTSGFVTIKGLLLAWAIAQLDWTERHLAVAVRVGTVLILVVLAAAVVNLAIPGPWEAVLVTDTNAAEARSFLPSLVGPFTHPLDLGQFTALSFVTIAAWRATVRKTPFTLVLLVATALGALATARRTAIGSVVAAWLWLQAKRRATTVLVALLACLPVAVLVLAAPLAEVAQETYQDYIGKGTPEARTVLTVDSVKVAAAHFPLGAGFGRFGSAGAAAYYSPEYVARGYPYVWGLGRTEEEGRFLTDTEWPAIVGEAGFFGAAAFALGLLAAYRAGLRLWTSRRSALIRWAGLTSAGWIVASLVQSVATVTFTGPPVFGAGLRARGNRRRALRARCCRRGRPRRRRVAAGPAGRRRRRPGPFFIRMTHASSASWDDRNIPDVEAKETLVRRVLVSLVALVMLAVGLAACASPAPAPPPPVWDGTVGPRPVNPDCHGDAAAPQPGDVRVLHRRPRPAVDDHRGGHGGGPHRVLGRRRHHGAGHPRRGGPHRDPGLRLRRREGHRHLGRRDQRHDPGQHDHPSALHPERRRRDPVLRRRGPGAAQPGARAGGHARRRRLARRLHAELRHLARGQPERRDPGQPVRGHPRAVPDGRGAERGGRVGQGVSRNWLFQGNYCDAYAKAQSVAFQDVQNVTIADNEMAGEANKAFALGQGSTGAVVRNNKIGSGYGREVGFDDPSAQKGYHGRLAR